MALLTTSQLTFYDMKDAYHVEINPDYIVVKCDENGNSKEATNIEIEYGIYCGSTRVPGTATVDFKIDGEQVQYEGTNCTAKEDGKITFTEITKDTNFTVIDSIHITFKEHNAESNGDDFTFEKYIKFVKVTDGVNGSDGTGLVFKVYSEDGTVFREDMSEINLETVLHVGESEDKAASYQWEYWDDTIETPAWTAIANENEDQSTLMVSKSADWAQKTIRCKIEYNGNPYYDYISLTDDVNVYTSVIKYATTNVFTSSDKYLIAYMAVYKNGEEIDMLQTGQFADADSVGDDGVISTTVQPADGDTFESGDLIYFIVPDTTYSTVYNIVLGQYNEASWKAIDFIQDYFYTNSKSYNNLSRSSSYSYANKIMVVSKEEVNKTLAISFSAYKTIDEPSLFSSADGNVVDLNDPIVGGVQPTNPVKGQLWIDTSITPYVVKVCCIDADGNISWTVSNEYSGSKLYTSKPSSYSTHDVWILNVDEHCEYEIDGTTYAYGPGSMLRAANTSDTFNASDWSEIKSDMTTARDHILQSYSWHPTTGVIIGQENNKFYVNITATEMGFYDNSNPSDPHNKVVSVGSQSATIKSLSVEEGTTFHCDTDFNNQINIYNPYSSVRSGFTWKIETNGSLSLICSNSIQKTIRGTWEDVFASEADGTYKQKYKIGDTIPLDLGDEGIIDMQIAAFNADTLANGGGEAKITWISKQILTTPHEMNPALVTNDDGTYQEGTGAIGKFVDSSMYQYLTTVLMPLIPQSVLNNIKKVTKTYKYCDVSGNVYETNDNMSLWIPSFREIGATSQEYSTNETYGPIYSDLFMDDESRIKYYIHDVEKTNTWYTRSLNVHALDYDYYDYAILVSKTGYVSNPEGNSIWSIKSNAECGVVIGFCT